MHTHRQKLLAMLTRLDQLSAEADAILAEPVYSDPAAMAEDLRETLVEMWARVEERIERIMQ